jgi:hypothetical protein
VAALAVVEDLDEVEHGGPQRLAGWPVVAVQQLAFQGGEEALGDGVVERVTDGAIEATRPVSVRRLPNARLVYWVDSTGRRNTSTMRSCDGSTETAPVGSGGSASDAFAWSAAGGAA